MNRVWKQEQERSSLSEEEKFLKYVGFREAQVSAVGTKSREDEVSL